MSVVKRRIISAIKNRDDIKSMRISLFKLLQTNNMENYAEICCSRIIQESENDDLESEGIEVYASIGPRQYEVLLTADGILESKNVLLDYIPEESLEDTFVLLCEERRIVMEVNSVAKRLRETKTIEIIKELFRMGIRRKEEYKDVCYYYLLEFFCRSYLWRIIKEIRNMAEEANKKKMLKSGSLNF